MAIRVSEHLNDHICLKLLSILITKIIIDLRSINYYSFYGYLYVLSFFFTIFLTRFSVYLLMNKNILNSVYLLYRHGSGMRIINNDFLVSLYFLMYLFKKEVKWINGENFFLFGYQFESIILLEGWKCERWFWHLANNKMHLCKWFGDFYSWQYFLKASLCDFDCLIWIHISCIKWLWILVSDINFKSSYTVARTEYK